MQLIWKLANRTLRKEIGIHGMIRRANLAFFLSFFFGAGITIFGTAAIFILLNWARDTSSGFHLITIEAGWIFYACYKIILGIDALRHDRKAINAESNIAFGAGVILMLPALLFIPLH